MAAQMNGNAAQTKIDNARERELYRYFQPPAPSSETLIAHQASSPDTTLTALAQLCALRLHSKRAMIRSVYIYENHPQIYNQRTRSCSELELISSLA